MLRGDVAIGLIADGVHVAPTMAVLLQRLAPGQVVIVSDALAPYGLGEGAHRWDERLMLVQDGSCRLEDGTLAGVTLPLLEGVVRLARWSGEPDRAIAAATLLPRSGAGGSNGPCRSCWWGWRWRRRCGGTRSPRGWPGAGPPLPDHLPKLPHFCGFISVVSMHWFHSDIRAPECFTQVACPGQHQLQDPRG